MEEIAKEGACFNCGFLCRRDSLNLARTDVYEITREDRAGGRLFLGRLEEHLVPWCFRDVPITKEIEEASGVSLVADSPPDERQAQLAARSEAARRVVSKDRQCPLWLLYQPGLGPRDHLAGKAMRDMEEDRRRFLESLERQRQDFERELAASRDIFTMNLAEASNRDQNRTAAITTALTWAAVILAIAQVLTALMALTCESLLWTWTGITALGCP